MSVAQLRVELVERLVEQQRLRLGQQRAHQRDARALPARQRGRVAVGKAAEVGFGERLLDAPRCAPIAPARAARSANARLPPTDRCGNRRSSWNRMPMRRASGASARDVAPADRTRPRRLEHADRACPR